MEILKLRLTRTSDAADALLMGTQTEPSGATVHLVIGSTGAGKTTYAAGLAERVAGVRFSIDEWMTRLFFPDRPIEATAAWYLERISRCTDVIWQASRRILRVGRDVVLEVGLTQKDERIRFYGRVDHAQVALRLYVLEAPVEVRWERVNARNQRAGGTYPMQVTRAMFDFVEGMWECPDDQELAARRGERVQTG